MATEQLGLTNGLSVQAIEFPSIARAGGTPDALRVLPRFDIQRRCSVSIRKTSFLGLISVFLAGLALGGTIPNWPAPATWSAPRSHGISTLSETNPLPFIAVTPCRVADTRGNGFSGAYGPPSLVANATRSFTITGQCAIPASAAAVSFNFAALNVGAAGDLRVFPAGGSVPLASTLNYNANTPNIANAAVVPLGTGGAIMVQADAVSIDLIIDVNGYYASFLNANESLFIGGVINSAVIEGVNSSSQGIGIEGFEIASSGSTTGVWGESSSTGVLSTGVFGRASAATGGTYGVWGQTYSVGGVGVYGQATATTGAVYGVYGQTISGSGIGVYGVNGSISGSGVGVYGANASTSSFANAVQGVIGSSAPGGFSAGVRGINNGTAGSGIGVYGSQAGSGWGVYGTVSGAGNGVAGSAPLTGYGVYAFGNFGGSGAKYFVEPHPTDATKVIRYVSLEGPESGTYFRGSAQVVNGRAVIDVPEDFRIVTDTEGLTAQLTPVGASASMYVVSEDLNQIVVQSNRDVKFHYMVNGVRKAYKDHQTIANGNEFVPQLPTDRIPSYLTEEAKQRLISNGTYNADGTVNMETAKRLGWTKMWAEPEDRAKAAAEANAAEHAAMLDERK